MLRKTTTRNTLTRITNTTVLQETLKEKESEENLLADLLENILKEEETKNSALSLKEILKEEIKEFPVTLYDEERL